MYPTNNNTTQVRAFGQKALDTLVKSGASASGPPPAARDITSETSQTLSSILTVLPRELCHTDRASPNAPIGPRHPLLLASLQFQASLVTDLVSNRKFSRPEVWERCIAPYMDLWLGKGEGAKFAENVRSHFAAIDKVFISASSQSYVLKFM